MPSMKPGRVTRSAIVWESWQSMQATGCLKCCFASEYGILLSTSKPFMMSPFPSFFIGT